MAENFDSWLDENGPVALTLTENLDPALGRGAVIFPPTFAPPEDSDEKPGYIVDKNGVGLVDTVGSQANRLEPMFLQKPLQDLVRQVTIQVGDRKLNLLEASHRAADAVVRYSSLRSELRAAFIAYRDRGDAEALAKLAPTSLVFGVWDSRDTYTKIPRLIESVVRAYGCEQLTRAAQFTPSLDSDEIEEMGLSDLGKKLGELGLKDSPSGRTAGGIVARDGIRREALLNLIPLRALAAEGEVKSKRLQRYILGLALVALAAPTQLHLRQGCVLVAAEGKPADLKLVWRDGRRVPVHVTTEDALAFAHAAAKEFGVGEPIAARFDPKLVKEDAEAKAAKKSKKNAAVGN